MSSRSSRSRRFFPALALLAASVTGCVSVGVARTKAGPLGVEGAEGVVQMPTGEGAIEISIYDDPKSKKANVLSKRGFEIDLVRLEEGRERRLDRLPGPACSKPELVAGTYRFRVRKAAPQRGEAEDHPEEPIVQKDLRIRAGEVTHADVILKKFPTTTVLVTAGVVAAGIGIAAAASAPNFKAFGSNSRKTPKPKKCARHVDPDREARRGEPAPLLELLRPITLR